MCRLLISFFLFQFQAATFGFVVAVSSVFLVADAPTVRHLRRGLVDWVTGDVELKRQVATAKCRPVKHSHGEFIRFFLLDLQPFFVFVRNALSLFIAIMHQIS